MNAHGYMTKGKDVKKVDRVSHDGRGVMTRWCPHCDYSYHMTRELVPITACPKCGAVWSLENPHDVPPVEPQAESVTKPATKRTRAKPATKPRRKK